MSLPPPDSGAVVAVTGASSGIGAQIAELVAQRGYPLLLVARRRELLDVLATRLTKQHRVAVEVLAADLGDAAGRAAVVTRLGDRPVAGLVNCAGFGSSGTFADLPVDRELEQIAVNVSATVELTHAALAGMRRRGTGAVLNIGSIAGFQPVPGGAVYSAAKAFVSNFSEAVHEELHGSGVSCGVLCPGPVPTDWWALAGDEPPAGIAQLSAAEVAAAAVEAMVRGDRMVVPGLVPKLMGWGGRFAPRRLLLPALRRSATRKG